MLKRLSLILVVAVVAWGLPLSAPAPADATQSYMLTCQIGPMNTVRLDFEGGVPGGFGYTDVNFQKASGPASSGLQPGQCAWPDRGMNANEPSWLCAQARGTLGLNTVTFRGTTVTQVTYIGGGNALLQAVLHGPTQLMNIYVYSGPGTYYGPGPCLFVDHFGP
jgi:hypothetical protein